MSCLTIPRASETLRRAEFELTLAGEQQLAHNVASIRHTVGMLVQAIQNEREAVTELAQRAARRDAQLAIARLRGERRA
jgi:hypothetical protein